MNKKQQLIVLDEYESEILDAFESGKLKPVESQADFQAIARNTMQKNRKPSSLLQNYSFAAANKKHRVMSEK